MATKERARSAKSLRPAFNASGRADRCRIAAAIIRPDVKRGERVARGVVFSVDCGWREAFILDWPAVAFERAPAPNVISVEKNPVIPGVRLASLRHRYRSHSLGEQNIEVSCDVSKFCGLAWFGCAVYDLNLMANAARCWRPETARVRGVAMLEEIGAQYVGQPAAYQQSARLGALIVGAVLAGIFHRAKDTMQRAPYFALYGFLFLVLAAAQLAWLGAEDAIAAGHLWALGLGDLVVPLAAGYGVAVIAMARSRDAYGNARAAFSAFIPLIFLFLFLAPSRAGQSTDRALASPILNGWRGVAIGLCCIIGGIAALAWLAAQTRIASSADSSAHGSVVLNGQNAGHVSSISPELSAQNVRNGLVMWAAFSCSAVAANAQSSADQERLLLIGYRAGLAFIRDIQNRRINKHDLDRQVPMAVFFALGGPTPDFMLGRVYAAAEQAAWEDVDKASSGNLDQDIRQFHSKNLFTQKNCALIGSPSQSP